MRSVLSIALVALVLACAPRTETADPAATATTATTDTATPEAAREAVDQLRQRWVEAAERDDAAAVAALYTDDAVVTSPQDEPARGRDAIMQLWQTQFPVSTNLRVNPSRTEAGREVVAEYGTFTQTITPPNATAQEFNGDYLVISRRQDDGSWRIALHMSFPRTAQGQAAGTTTATTTTR